MGVDNSSHDDGAISFLWFSLYATADARQLVAFVSGLNGFNYLKYIIEIKKKNKKSII
jgi:hypothetical protein